MEDQKPVEVTASLKKYDGPWKRTRGGREEYFLKMHYSYFVDGIEESLKKEVSLKSPDNLDKVLQTNDVIVCIVDANNPGSTLAAVEQPFADYIILLFASIVLLIHEHQDHRSLGGNRRPY